MSLTEAGRQVLQNKRSARPEQLARALSAGFSRAERTPRSAPEATWR